MNGRIQELDKQAWDYVDATWDWTNPDKPSKAALFKTKFAELIVRECIGIVKEYSEDGPHCQCQMIKQHFGVD